MNDKPPCRGILWSGLAGAPCERCVIATPCSEEYIKNRLEPAQRKLGDKATFPKLAELLNTPIENILLAVAIQKNIPISEPTPVVVEPVTQQPVVQERKRSWEWDDKHNQARWERERKRSTLVAMLTPGMKIRTTYKGEDYELVVQKGGYEFKGEKYPTLYAATKAAIGTTPTPKQLQKGKRPEGYRRLVSYSGPKFWKLEKFLIEKGLLKPTKKKKKSKN